jgi:hypothetical protein
MTVNELIQQLSKLNPDTPVQMQYTNSCADYGMTKKCTGISTIQLGKRYETHGPDVVTIASDGEVQ